MKENREKKLLSSNLLAITILGLALSMTSIAEAGRGHHGHHHHHHYYDDYHHHDGYAVYLNHPRGYYNRPYYPQPRYGYNFNPAPVPIYAPAPAYAYPPNVILDIDTRHGHFMFRY